MIFRPKGLRGLSPDRVRNHQAFRRISEAEESRYHQLNQSGLSDTFLIYLKTSRHLYLIAQGVQSDVGDTVGYFNI